MSSKTRNPLEIRKQVSETYAKAVEAQGRGPCAPTGLGAPCCGTDPLGLPRPKGSTAVTAGYGDEIAALPSDAVVNAFGCGNPLAFSEVSEGEVVLDLGSGAGIDLLIAADRVGERGRVIGVDMTDAMIEHARRNIAEAGAKQVEVRKGLIEDLPVDDASVDWVISNCVINLSPEKPKVFAEIARVLKPGGRVSISDIVAAGLPQWARDSADLYSACVAGAIDEAAYLDGLRDAGLEGVEVTERFVYSAEQLLGLMSSEELPAFEAQAAPGRLRQAAEELAGRVWSARVKGRKPPA
jgi:ubiquinone/menaquinone biosynthesis C-methylase UbiE